jgi:hypothetical protein
MKFVIMLFIIFTSIANAKTSYSVQYYKNKDGSLVPIVKPYEVNEKVKGTGMEFQSEAKVSNGKVSTYIRSCGWVDIGNLNQLDENGKKIKNEKLEKVKNGDRLILKMTQSGTCNVVDWDFF